MGGEGFHAKSLRRVVSAQKQVDSQFFSRDRRPIGRFAGDKGIDALRCDGLELRAAGYRY
jgi:hypothetical protein